MKTPILFSVGFALIFAACGEEGQPSDETTQSTDQTIEQVEEVLTDTCCGARYQIYGETADLWHKTWLQLHPTLDTDTVFHRSFTEASIVELDELIGTRFPDTVQTGYRMYYGLKSAGDSIPILMMTVISYCDDVLLSRKACVMLSTTDNSADNKLIKADTASLYAARWRDFITDITIARSQVYAYNYKHAEIWEVLNDSSNTGNLANIAFGIRSTSPAELDFEHEEENGLKFGSIVYCNVLYGSETNPIDDQAFDFARPCPKLCGRLNILNDTTIHIP